MKFNIKLSPIARLTGAQTLEPLTLEKAGSIIKINGTSFDLSVIPDGATLPDADVATGCEYFSGSIERDDQGNFNLTLMLPHDDNAPEEARFPKPIIVTKDGVVELPNVFEPKEEEDDN